MTKTYTYPKWSKIALATTILTAISLTSSWADGKLSKYTADFYRAQADSYLDKEITVKVTHVKPFRFKSDIPELRFFHAYTYDDKENIRGGWIIVAIPSGVEGAFVKKYGTVPSASGKKALRKSDAEKLKGVFRSDGKRLFYIDYEGSTKELIDARRQEIMEGLAKAGDPDTMEKGRGAGPRQ